MRFNFEILGLMVSRFPYVIYFLFRKCLCLCCSDFKFKVKVLGFSEKVFIKGLISFFSVGFQLEFVGHSVGFQAIGDRFMGHAGYL